MHASNSPRVILYLRLCGWLYVTIWTLSYYPQPLLNYKRKSTEGYTFDYPILNVFGSVCYTLGTTLLFFSTTVREEYAFRHPGNPEPTVRFNDVIYGLHSVAITSATLSQFWPALWGWRKPSVRRPSKLTLSMVTGGSFGIILAAAIAFTHQTFGKDTASFNWLDVVYTLTYIKLAITLGKYIPQITLNHRRRSTQGFAIIGVTSDFVGGMISLVQLVIDSSLQADWSGLTGNPIKFGLANVSMAADVVFMVQHYVLYGAAEPRAQDCEEIRNRDDDAERESLLA